MHPQLEQLMEIQDLKAQRKELAQAGDSRQVQEEVFNVKIEDALTELDEKIQEMVEALPPAVRNRYQRLAGRSERPVVPVIRGTCFGCFVSIPTAVSSDAGRNEGLRNCDNCGRFIYMLD
jgi:predicted  nucleic acid-binding Zn-ribbon protein